MLLYHGSTAKYDTLIPHQAYDTGFEEGCQNAVYATTSEAMAICFALGAVPDENGEIEREMLPEYGEKIMPFDCGLKKTIGSVTVQQLLL